MTDFEAPRLYIEEWMATVPGLDRKRLAERMKVAGGTISKKLARPENIDGVWLAQFATALELSSPIELYRDPQAAVASPESKLRAALLAFGVDKDDLGKAVAVVKGFLDDDGERSAPALPGDRSAPASRRRATEPSR
ncbi:hypothetical protein [Aminobacter sp. MDW-2]|uniref:hypothetical protein n=1 Tax=Aminobacter sp. MDW-2 TaxID=2666139 RepID=UPI0012B078CF|nr:hypothetical protein [Aminobacter sp. MDW-2]MRX37142.1 hypothetical protein [Aminobacter sp. MDW-2]QNH33307.1 hypothetical protein H5P29_22770 [Aminobacter sp. MDW-2]